MEGGEVTAFLHFCRANPSLLLFAALAGGYALGKVKFGKSFSLGSTTSVLLVSIVVGALILGNTEYDLGLIKSISFGFFIFAIGYRVGPDFVGGLKRGGMKYVLVAVFFAVTALIAAIALARAFGLNEGYAGGLIGGALTQSSVIGTADNALQHLTSGSTTSVLNLKSDVAVAYAVTYVFGTAGLIMLLKVIGRIWKIDLPKAARQAESEMGSIDESDTIEAFHWSNLVLPRAYNIQKDAVIGKNIGEVEALFEGFAAIDMLRRGGKLIDTLALDMKLQKDDIIILTGFRKNIYNACDTLGPEVNDDTLKEMLGEILGICLTNRALDGKTLDEIFGQHGHGCFIRSVTRQGHDLPLNSGLRIYRGDIINVIGDRPDVEKLVKVIGYPERQSKVTDLISVSVGLIIGTLVGLLSVSVGGVPITLGVGGGVLVSGIFFGWLRSVRPTWGRIPTATQWVFTDLGLNFFIACVGLAAGPRAVHAIQQAGMSIFFAGICLTIIPHLLTWVFGYHLLKMNPVLLFGAMTGAGTCTAAMNSVKEDARSAVPVIGYTVPYAIGNVLLTVWGALIVSLV